MKSISAFDIASDLRGIGVDCQVNADWCGQTVDLLATTPNGQTIAVLIKCWENLTPEMICKAELEGTLMSASVNSRAFILIHGLEEHYQTKTVCDLHGLMNAVTAIVTQEVDFRLRGTRGRRSDELPDRPLKHVFVAMPFADRFEDTYYLGILPAVRRAKASCFRVDTKYFSKTIMESVHSGIRGADLLVADLTEGNPNVSYELGYAHALSKASIHLSAEPPEKLPFDVRDWPTMPYRFGQVHLLVPSLTETLRRLLSPPPS